jgi:hypothetical protein
MAVMSSLNTFSSTAEQAAAYQAWAERMKAKGARERAELRPPDAAADAPAANVARLDDQRSTERLAAWNPLV